ncbi:hypothetical protein ICN30_02805 [Polynucleobacter sp. 31A-FELB]|jgi:predicted O-linked N-acetylglucosamine transferase (SPINDLY family)|nr:hypothetical protein [Polynucleobacter sp. 31A-FELB]
MNEAQANKMLDEALGFLRAQQITPGIQKLIELLKLEVNNPKAIHLIRLTCDSLPDKNQAIHLLQYCSEQGIHSPILQYDLGSLYLSIGQYPLAANAFEGSLQQSPHCFEALHDLGATFALMGNIGKAKEQFLKAAKVNDQSADLFYNLGRLCDEQYAFEQAITFYQKAVNLDPAFTMAWINLAIDLAVFKKYDDALDCFEVAYKQDPNIDFLYGDCRFIKMRMCNWENAQETLQMLQEGIERGQKIIAPFPLMALLDFPALIQKAAAIYAKARYPQNNSLEPIPYYSNKKIRIAYFSPDFHEHPVSFLTAELFELHDRDRFEIYAFSFGKKTKDAMRKRLEAAFDNFVDVADKTSYEICLMAREAQIDIAVDLCGYTENARSEIFSLRAAPIQISYIGFLGTMGSEWMDYLIADEVIIPKNLRKFYSEKIIYLPSYQSNDSQRSSGEKSFRKSDLGISENQFVFCNLNNVYKITESIFHSWLNILRKVENSVLLLYSENPWATENLQTLAVEYGIDSARLIFTSHLPRSDYLAQYAIADLFLDTYPYNAGTTASDSLWMGVPVITLQGESFSSRVASSLLINLKLAELIHHSIEDYEAQAIELANNQTKLNGLKNKLAANRLTEPLFNTKLFVKHLEQAFSTAHQRYEAKLPTDDIASTDYQHKQT